MDNEPRISTGVTDFSRRAFIGGGLALVGASTLPLPAFAAAQRAIPAKSFVNTVGIVTHPSWRTTLWGTSDWESAFLETGVKNTRGKIGRGTAGQGALLDLQKLFGQGIKICATVADQKDGLDRVGTKANIDFLANSVGAHNLSGIESANEYSKPSTRPADWAVQLREFHKWLYDTIRANPSFNDVPVVAPSIWGRITADYIELGNLEPQVDRGCMHYYTGGRRPSIAGKPSTTNELGGKTSYTMADAIREAKVLAPNKPLWITEYGYPVTGPNDPLSGFVITERAAAKYIIRGLLDAFGEGVENISIYSLIDDVHRSKYHGLMDGALKRRSTFYAVKNLMELFADSGNLSVAGSLDYSVSNATATIKRQLFQKSDGTFLLTMYQDVDSYNRAKKQDVVVAPISVDLSLVEASTIEVFTPSIGANVTQSVTDATALTIPVEDHVTIVKIKPGGGTLTSTSTTTQSTSTTSQDPFEFKTPPPEE